MKYAGYKDLFSNIHERENPVVSLVLRCLRNGHIVEVGDLLLADSGLLFLPPVAVDAVEVSVLVFPGEDSVKL